jgi:hypothetical protein
MSPWAVLPASAAEAKADVVVFFKGLLFVLGLKHQSTGACQQLQEMAAETTFGKPPERKLVQTPRSAEVSQRFSKGGRN